MAGEYGEQRDIEEQSEESTYELMEGEVPDEIYELYFKLDEALVGFDPDKDSYDEDLGELMEGFQIAIMDLLKQEHIENYPELKAVTKEYVKHLALAQVKDAPNVVVEAGKAFQQLVKVFKLAQTVMLTKDDEKPAEKEAVDANTKPKNVLIHTYVKPLIEKAFKENLKGITEGRDAFEYYKSVLLPILYSFNNDYGLDRDHLISPSDIVTKDFIASLDLPNFRKRQLFNTNIRKNWVKELDKVLDPRGRTRIREQNGIVINDKIAEINEVPLDDAMRARLNNFDYAKTFVQDLLKTLDKQGIRTDTVFDDKGDSFVVKAQWQGLIRIEANTVLDYIMSNKDAYQGVSKSAEGNKLNKLFNKHNTDVKPILKGKQRPTAKKLRLSQIPEHRGKPVPAQKRPIPSEYQPFSPSSEFYDVFNAAKKAVNAYSHGMTYENDLKPVIKRFSRKVLRLMNDPDIHTLFKPGRQKYWNYVETAEKSGQTKKWANKALDVLVEMVMMVQPPEPSEVGSREDEKAGEPAASKTAKSKYVSTGKTPKKRGDPSIMKDDWMVKHVVPFLEDVEKWANSHPDELDELMASEEGREKMVVEVWGPRLRKHKVNPLTLFVEARNKILQIGGTNYLTRKLFGMKQANRAWRDDKLYQDAIRMASNMVETEKRHMERKRKKIISNHQRMEELAKLEARLHKRNFKMGEEQHIRDKITELGGNPPPRVYTSSESVSHRSGKSRADSFGKSDKSKPDSQIPAPKADDTSMADSMRIYADDTSTFKAGSIVYEKPPPVQEFPAPPPAQDQPAPNPFNLPAVPQINQAYPQINAGGQQIHLGMQHVVAPLPIAAPPNEPAAWLAFENRHHRPVMRHFIANNQHRQYLRYNPLTDDIEPVRRHAVHFRQPRTGGRRNTRYEEIHELRPHPYGKRPSETDVHAVSRLVDPLHDVVGKASKLGSFIQLKAMPNILNICIKKGVQIRALYLLAKRLLEQNRSNFTHLLIKRKRSGKYVFRTLFSTKQLAKETPETLGDELARLIKGRKYIHLIAKPNMRMNKSFDEEHLLK